MMDALLLVLAVCMDSLIVSIAYGTKNVKIPLRSVLIIALFGSLSLSASLYLAKIIQIFISKDLCTMLSFIILLMIGVCSLFQNQLKRYLKHHTDGKLKFKFKEISIVIDVYIDEMKADMDHSNYLSAKEAIYLAVALSIDSLASGIAFGMGTLNPQELFIISLVVGIGMIILGQCLGKKLSDKVSYDISWLSGVILIILAFTRMRRIF